MELPPEFEGKKQVEKRLREAAKIKIMKEREVRGEERRGEESGGAQL